MVSNLKSEGQPATPSCLIRCRAYGVAWYDHSTWIVRCYSYIASCRGLNSRHDNCAEDAVANNEQENLELIKELIKEVIKEQLKEQMKFQNQFRIEEYKDRRAEINDLIKDTRSLELYALIGMLAYYAWL